MRPTIGAWLGTLVLTLPVAAEPPARYRFSLGEESVYQVEQTTTATEVIKSRTSETTTRLRLTKKWKVTDLDAKGTATLVMSLSALKMETANPNGETITLFDSAQMNGADEETRKQMARYLSEPLATVQVDAQGRLVSVKESKFGPASRFESELPFRLTLPDAALAPGTTWHRTYTVTLEPPHGVGDKVPAKQDFACTKVENGRATISVKTTLNVPGTMTATQRIPLLASMSDGEAIFDVTRGRLLRVHYQTEKEVVGHQGEESVYRMKSDYREWRVEND